LGESGLQTGSKPIERKARSAPIAIATHESPIGHALFSLSWGCGRSLGEEMDTRWLGRGRTWLLQQLSRRAQLSFTAIPSKV